MSITLSPSSQVEGDYTAAQLSEVLLLENSYAQLATIGYGDTEQVVVTGSVNPVALPSDWSQVASVVSGNQAFIPTTTPESPQSGEFLYNPYTNTVQVYSASGVGQSIQVYGTLQTIQYSPPLLPPPYPALFTNLPLTGSIQITKAFEQFPTASFEFESTLAKTQLQSIFTPGGELDLYGIPVRLNNVNITERKRTSNPDSRCKVSVSLGSRWQNYSDQPCFLRSDGSNIAPNNTPFQDPDCASGSTTATTNPNASTTIQKLLAKINIPYAGPPLALVPIPQNTPRDATVNPLQLLNDRLRIANCFLRWSHSSGAELVPINGANSWTYLESDILEEAETSYEAISKPSKKFISIPNLNPLVPDLINFPSVITPTPTPQLHGELSTNLSFEYANVELTGEFSQTAALPQKSTQGNSPTRYVRKESKRTTRIEGDSTADTVLEGVTSVEVMSLCFDIGGQTKTRTYVTEENGTKVTELNEIWGFAYTADSIYSAASDKLIGNPNELWKCLKKTRTDYSYDDGTGYLIDIVETGYNTVRFKQESADSPETLGLDPSDDNYPLYSFIQIPVFTRTNYGLRIMPNYNTTDGLSETYKVCNRDGTSTTQLLLNPDYSPPYYIENERTESIAFTSSPNPDNVGVTPDSSTKLEPDLITGEESQFKAITTVVPAIYEEIFTSEGMSNGAELSPQRYSKYIKEFKAQGAAIATALEKISTENGTGNPPPATKRSPRYQKEQNPQNQSKVQTPVQQYRYLLQTQGYTVQSPVGGSESFSVAATFAQALTAAKCKLAIENWRTGLTERLQIAGNLAIAEGDRFNYFCNGEYRQRVVLGAATTLNILGVVNGQPMITAVTALTLGRYVIPLLGYSKIPVPPTPKAPQSSSTIFNVINDTLGTAIDWSTVRSRRNP